MICKPALMICSCRCSRICLCARQLYICALCRYPIVDRHVLYCNVVRSSSRRSRRKPCLWNPNDDARIPKARLLCHDNINRWMKSTARITDRAQAHDGSADGAVVYAESPLEAYLRECVPEELEGVVQAMENRQQAVAVGSSSSSSRAGSRRDSQSSSAGGSDRGDKRTSRRRSGRRRSSGVRQRVRAQGEVRRLLLSSYRIILNAQTGIKRVVYEARNDLSWKYACIKLISQERRTV